MGGAIHDKKGIVELAAGGTLFFGHIAKLPPSLQGKLIRLMNEHSFYKLGGVSTIQTDVRIIAATDQDLKPLVARGRFRQDLYYQLSVMQLTVPPLRERKDDILLLADYFLSRRANQSSTDKKELAKEARTALLSYSWPANVREL